MPTGDVCGEDMGGGRRLRGDKNKEDDLAQLQHVVVGDRKLWGTSCSMVSDHFMPAIGETCLDITNISYFMTIFYTTFGKKYEIGK